MKNGIEGKTLGRTEAGGKAKGIGPVNSSASPESMQDPPASELESETWWSRIGLPRFRWTLTLLGLCIYTFVIVTFYVPLAIAGIAISVVGLFFGRERVRLPFPVWLYVAFVFWAFLASFASPYPDIAQEQLVERLKLLVILVVVVNALRTEGQLRFYFLFFLACFILFPIRGALIGGDTIQGRAVWTGIYNNPNDLAALSVLALGIASAIAMSETSRSLMRLGVRISAMLILVVILLTQSRGAFLGIIVATAPLLLSMLAKQRRRAIGLLVVVALLVHFVVPVGVWERLAGITKLTSVETIAESDPEGSAAERFMILQTGWQILLDHPVFGVGLGAYPLANDRYAPELGPKDTHNTYLNLAAEVGLPGLLLWCALVGSVLRYAYRSRRLVGTGTLATQQLWIERGLVAYLVAALFGSFSALNFPYIFLAALWCSATLLSDAAPGSANSSRKW